jgi:CBS domain-containing protein
VSGITLGAFGSRLRLAAPGQVPAQVAGGSGLVGMGSGDPRVDAGMARAGLAVTGLCGTLLVVAGALAPGGVFALVGQVALWVGTFALLVTLVDGLPAPRTPGGFLLAAAVLRRTGSPQRAEAVVARTGVVVGWTLIAAGIGAIFTFGLVGLWAVLLGWLALASSRLAQARQRTNAAFDGLFVRDVMTPASATLSAWRTVASALDDVVLPSRQSVFGVEDFDGPLAGVVLLPDLAAVPMDDRGLARVSRVTIPLHAVATARPDEPLTAAMNRLTQRPRAGCVVVVDDDPDGRVRMVGVIGPVELTRAMQIAPLRGRTIIPSGLGPWAR